MCNFAHFWVFAIFTLWPPPSSPKWCLLAPLCCRTFLGLIACVSTHLQLGDGAPQPPWPATTVERNAHASQPAGWHASGPRPAQLPCDAYPRFRGQFQLDGGLVCISTHLQAGDGAPQPPRLAATADRSAHSSQPAGWHASWDRWEGGPAGGRQPQRRASIARA